MRWAVSGLSKAMKSTTCSRSSRASAVHSTRRSATLAAFETLVQARLRRCKNFFRGKCAACHQVGIGPRDELQHCKRILRLLPGFVTLDHRASLAVLGQDDGRLMLQTLDPATGVVLELRPADDLFSRHRFSLRTEFGPTLPRRMLRSGLPLTSSTLTPHTTCGRRRVPVRSARRGCSTGGR